MKRTAVMLFVGGVGIMTILSLYALARQASRGGESAPLYSSLRHDPYGTAALRDLLRERNVEVRLLRRSRPTPASDHTLIQVLPRIEDDTAIRPDPQALAEWIRSGNTVIQFTASPTPLMNECDVPEWSSSTEEWQEFEEAMVRGAAPTTISWETTSATWTRDANSDTRTLRMHAPGRLPDEGPRWTPLAEDRSAIVAGSQRVGSGQLVVIASSTPILNSVLAEEDNLDIVLELIGSGPVWFDEWSHGIGHGGTMLGQLARLGLFPVMMQVIVVVALMVWRTSGSRRVEDQPAPRNRSTIEQVVTLGHLYGHTLELHAITQRTHHEVRRRFAAALGTPLHLLDRRLERLEGPAATTARELIRAGQSVEVETESACPSCGYLLHALASEKCPECGQRVPTESTQPQPTSSSKERAAAESDMVDLLKRVQQCAEQLAADTGRQHGITGYSSLPHRSTRGGSQSSARAG
jgi:hypothetical protein